MVIVQVMKLLGPENHELAKARREHMDESNCTEMSPVTDNRDRLCEELLCILGRRKNKLYRFHRILLHREEGDFQGAIN